MTQRRFGSQVLQVLKMSMVCGSVIGLLTGCSSRLQTTVVSGNDVPKVKVTHLPPEPIIAEEVVLQPIQEEIGPAVPTIDIPIEEPARPMIRREFLPEIFAKSKTPDVPSEISSPFEPSPPPVQVAKVMPEEPEKVEITAETLEKALSDIYFDFDRFSIREDAMSLLKGNAQLLTAELAEKSIVIEGHCDERGTQSYNIVLGEARANAAKTFLEHLGVSADKLQVLSYGKDKPFCKEQTEECWQENRRGHFVIQ